MSFAAYIKFSGIDGDSTDPSHPKWIPVLSFHWGAESKVRRGRREDLKGKVDVTDFSIVKAVDITSPILFTKCVNGDVILKVNLDLVEVTPGKQRWQRTYAEYCFEKAYVTSVRPGGGGGSDTPLEEVSVNFETVTYKYYGGDTP